MRIRMSWPPPPKKSSICDTLFEVVTGKWNTILRTFCWRGIRRDIWTWRLTCSTNTWVWQAWMIASMSWKKTKIMDFLVFALWISSRIGWNHWSRALYMVEWNFMLLPYFMFLPYFFPTTKRRSWENPQKKEFHQKLPKYVKKNQKSWFWGFVLWI